MCDKVYIYLQNCAIRVDSYLLDIYFLQDHA